jgi:hypothetical protein
MNNPEKLTTLGTQDIRRRHYYCLCVFLTFLALNMNSNINVFPLLSYPGRILSFIIACEYLHSFYFRIQYNPYNIM